MPISDEAIVSLDLIIPGKPLWSFLGSYQSSQEWLHKSLAHFADAEYETPGQVLGLLGAVVLTEVLTPDPPTSSN
jgi:hypothetical protein